MSDPSPEAVKPPAGPSELTLRVLSGVVMAVLAIGTAWIDGWSFGLFWTMASVLVLREWLSLIGLGGTRMTICWTVGGLAIAFAGTMAEVSEAPEPRAWAVVMAGALLAAALAPSRRGWAAAGVVYAAVLAVVPIDLRGDPSFGVVAIFWMFAVVWITDIAAYFVGRSVGGPKLWPRISPKKTWSGFIGGVAGGTLAGLAVVHVARNSYGLGWTFGGFGLVALTLGSAILSQGGDLFESSMKRRFGAKDSSHLIPGHGGVMDRLDSFWAVSVVLAVLLYASLPA